MANNLRYLLFFLCFVLFLISSCERGEVPKKVSLEKRSANEDTYVVPYDPGSLKFGFDLRLGPKEDVKIYLPFLRYLERNTGNNFSLRFTEKYEDTVKNLGKGVTDFAALGPVNCILAKEKYGVGCLVMGLNSEGKPEYRAAVFTKLNSPINDIKDLRGKTFAFGDRFSTQGHIIPRKMLEDAGITLKDLKRYVFSGSHVNTARAVLNGEYDAGGIQDTLAKRLVAEGKIKILAISKPYPSSLICFNKDVDPTIVKVVRTVLLSFDPKGKQAGVLVDWDRTEMPDGFTEYKESSLKEIRELVRRYGLLK
ncbi:phosphate-import protein PhnD precursor [bacterium BMS3Bbin06]|nr:phosphate-import protein PhnD precursor [bacterium BMS3Abin08]GBE34760.1 phosphate-import protein PhnD precursor [bacterium BMS3Bbin06]